jgi:hypothetical protein
LSLSLSESKKLESEVVSADARTSVMEHMSCWGRFSSTSPTSRLR